MQKQDIDFLKDLQHEMLTQDTVSQANPRFWVVRETKRRYGIDEEYGCDGTEVVYDGDTLAENLKELCEYLSESEEDLNIKYNEEDEEVNINENECFYNIEELIDYMRTELNYNDGLYITHYIDECVIVPSTMFLTKRECEEHIKQNHYHYNKPHSYAMTAWRSPQVEKLFDLIMNANWNLYKECRED
ncbi:hypothetical protein NSA24_03090 [Clostridioides mangenotii]|uniref:hypothetical protein n=1 Tax=Metaclostridioides mangenotii TaxID=1540 RepID=UPI00214A283B|nr:hypothetical protein [Clostridioides mangenotii]MCR1953819.1 hypothetical protein [Clostridioides mangenotii]